MKVCQPSENFNSLKKTILHLQLSFDFSQINELLSIYNELLLFFAKYNFLFKNVSLETQPLKCTHTNIESSLSTQDPARDGWNWYAYCSNNPLTFLDPDGCVPRKPTPTMGIAAHFAIIGNLKANDLENGVLAGPQLFLPNPTGEKKGGFFVDYTKPDLKGDTEFYEIKPSSYMKNNRGDKQLEKYINRDGEAVPGTELLSKIAEMEPIKTIMTTPLGTEEITITLSVDPENHPGMIFYDLDDGRTPEEYALKVAEKIVAPVVSAAMIVTGAGAGPEIPSMTAPIPAP